MDPPLPPSTSPGTGAVVHTPRLPRSALISPGVELATAAHSAVGDPRLDANTCGGPLRRRPAIAPVPRPLDQRALENAVYGSMAVPSAAASYFRFLPAMAYTLYCNPLGVVLDAIVPEREALTRRGWLPSVGQTRYGRVQRRLHIHRARALHCRTTFFMRGDGLEFPKEGCWSGDFSPRCSYRLLVYESGLAVYPQLDGGLVLTETLGGPSFGELLGEIRVSLPEGGLRRMEYMCY